MDDNIYISYIDEKFNKTHMKTNLNYSLNRTYSINKPLNAFWASREDAEFGWKDWCIDNDCTDWIKNKEIFRFKLSDNAKIFYIETVDDLENIPYYKDQNETDIILKESLYIDFDKMRQDGYDGIELLDPCIGHIFINPKEICFNSWDCQSITIWNPDIIVSI